MILKLAKCNFKLFFNIFYRNFMNDVQQSTSGKEVLVEKYKASNGIYILNFNQPSTKNALGFNLVNSLIENLQKLKNLKDVRVLILSSKVKGIFCAGANLKERYKMQIYETENFVDSLRSIAYEIYNFSFPTIAAIDGIALGGGLEMALACDIRIASDDAKLGLVETKLGILPGASGSQMLSRLIGLGKAKELIFTAKIINGNKAEEIGLVNKCVMQNYDGCAAFLSSIELAQEILPNGPIAIQAVKQAINQSFDLSLKDGLKIEKEAYFKVLNSKDRIEGLKAFIEKRKPIFTGQ